MMDRFPFRRIILGLLVGMACACGSIPRYVAIATATPIPTALTVGLPTSSPTLTPSLTFTASPSPAPSATPQPLVLTPTATAEASGPVETSGPPGANEPHESETNVPPLPSEDAPESADLELPSEAQVGPITGYDQFLWLSCESRSAADWAGYFGVAIQEMTFQRGLEYTHNPNTGFVGDPNGEPGQVPPYPYGVHAPPVAKLLRDYGLNAQARAGMTPNDLKVEISQGRPVIVWVIGHVQQGYGISYTAPDGETLTVAPWEHTVIVTAYNAETVTVLDGSQTYTAAWQQFLESWAILGNMGVVMVEE